MPWVDQDLATNSAPHPSWRYICHACLGGVHHHGPVACPVRAIGHGATPACYCAERPEKTEPLSSDTGWGVRVTGEAAAKAGYLMNDAIQRKKDKQLKKAAKRMRRAVRGISQDVDDAKAEDTIAPVPHALRHHPADCHDCHAVRLWQIYGTPHARFGDPKAIFETPPTC